MNITADSATASRHGPCMKYPKKVIDSQFLYQFDRMSGVIARRVFFPTWQSRTFRLVQHGI